MNRSTTISVLLVNTKKTVETACWKTTWPTQNERFDREPLNSSQCCVSLIFHDSVTFMVPPSWVNIIFRQGFSFSLEGTHHLLVAYCWAFRGIVLITAKACVMGETFGRQVKPFTWEWAVLSKQQPQPRTRSKIIYFSCFNKCLVHMAGDRGKRKAWMHCKSAKTPRTTAGEAKLLKKGTLVNVSRLIHRPECWLILKKVFSLSCVFEINLILRFLNETDSSTQPPISTKESGDSDPANLKVEVDNFLPFFVDPGSNSIACSCKESSKSDTEGFNCSSHNKFDGEQGETRDIIEEPAKSNGNLEDDNTPL